MRFFIAAVSRRDAMRAMHFFDLPEAQVSRHGLPAAAAKGSRQAEAKKKTEAGLTHLDMRRGRVWVYSQKKES